MVRVGCDCYCPGVPRRSNRSHSEPGPEHLTGLRILARLIARQTLTEEEVESQAEHRRLPAETSPTGRSGPGEHAITAETPPPGWRPEPDE